MLSSVLRSPGKNEYPPRAGGQTGKEKPPTFSGQGLLGWLGCRLAVVFALFVNAVTADALGEAG